MPSAVRRLRSQEWQNGSVANAYYQPPNNIDGTALLLTIETNQVHAQSGLVTMSTDASGRRTSYGYDFLGRLTSQQVLGDTIGGVIDAIKDVTASFASTSDGLQDAAGETLGRMASAAQAAEIRVITPGFVGLGGIKELAEKFSKDTSNKVVVDQQQMGAMMATVKAGGQIEVS